MNLDKIASMALGEIESKSKNSLYQKDFEAWASDVLGYRTYGKMQEIINETLFGKKRRTIIKSANGVSKSLSGAEMLVWAATVFEPGEKLCIVSAPSVPQIERVIFGYLKTFYSVMLDRGFTPRGKIAEDMTWKYDSPSGKRILVSGRKPPDHDAVSVFQGLRSEYGSTFVWFDEMGGLGQQMMTAAEAVLTGSDPLFLGTGNPDNATSAWVDLFTSERYEADYNRFTISAFDLPAFTGEIVYPDDPAMQEKITKSLTTREWVEHKQRIWGEKDARYLSKVLGEFPKESDFAFFKSEDILKARAAEIEPDRNNRPVIGFDVAAKGADESVIMVNYNGHIRPFVGTGTKESPEGIWGYGDEVDAARKVHEIANRISAEYVMIDAGGIGASVVAILDKMDEFQDKVYSVCALNASFKSPNRLHHYNMRAWYYDNLRQKMRDGKIDIDFDDTTLKDELELTTFKFAPNGGLQITPKDELRSEYGGSPDRLDAVVFAATHPDEIAEAFDGMDADKPRAATYDDLDIDGLGEEDAYDSVFNAAWMPN